MFNINLNLASNGLKYYHPQYILAFAPIDLLDTFYQYTGLFSAPMTRPMMSEGVRTATRAQGHRHRTASARPAAPGRGHAADHVRLLDGWRPRWQPVRDVAGDRDHLQPLPGILVFLGL